MKSNFGKALGAMSLAGLALASFGVCSAQCGAVGAARMKPSSLQLQAGASRLLRVADDDSTAIVGFWHVKFVSKGTAGIPDGTEVDAGYSQWHSDGTEIMNSAGHSPVVGNFCLGVWEMITPRQFKLNHFAALFDSTGTNLVGPVNIRETVTVGPGGKSFSGPFTIDIYDEGGNLKMHVQGNVTGTRILVDTLPSSIF